MTTILLSQETFHAGFFVTFPQQNPFALVDWIFVHIVKLKNDNLGLATAKEKSL